MVAVGVCDDGKAGEEIPVSKNRSSLHLAATLENFFLRHWRGGNKLERLVPDRVFSGWSICV